ncbi:MAG: polysaccharide biosynthesis/export family protein [Halomonas subglaciescola]|nr:polysaccharide biosynthesis/export family protein [Halomonas subglaciescola]
MRHSTPITFLAALGSVLWLSGCAFSPGSYFESNAESAPVNDLVDVEPITLGLVNSQRSAPKADDLSPKSDAQHEKADGYHYRIGKGDVLSITVYDHQELTIPSGSERSAAEAGNTVHDDGTIFYPFINRVSVEGKTVREVRSQIARRLEPYIAQPQVEVKIAAFKSQRVLVSGEVEKPGRQPITNVPMTVLDAISQTGGLTEQANWHGVQLTRDGETRTLSLYSMLNDGQLDDDLLLKDGDLLHVPDLANQRVFVMGEVGDPQALPMGRSRMSLTEALTRAGSFNEAQADASGIFVFRRQPEHSDKLATVYQLDARNAAAMVLGTEFLLEPTDVVYVTTTSLGRWNRVVNQMLPTITSIYQVTRTARDARDLKDDF